MSLPLNISERLDAEAEKGGPASAELAAAVTKLDSFVRAPGTRKQVDRLGAVLTPAVVRALGDAFVALREEEIVDPDTRIVGPDFQQGDYALGGLLLASVTPDLAEAARPALERVRDMTDRMLPKQAEHVQFLVGLYAESPLAAELADAARRRLGEEPATLAATWATSIGLDLPAEYWSLYLSVPAEVIGDGFIDAILTMSLDNTPGSETTWSIRIGSANANSLGGNRRPSHVDSEHGSYVRTGGTFEPPGDIELAGHVAPASGPEELPRILREIRAAHSDVTWDPSALTVSGTPGRLISPTKKKLLIAWLSGD